MGGGEAGTRGKANPLLCPVSIFGVSSMQMYSHTNHNSCLWGTRVAHWAKRLTLDFGSGHDLGVPGFKPHIGLHPDHVKPAWNSLSPSLSAPPLLAHVRSLALSLSPPPLKTNK